MRSFLSLILLLGTLHVGAEEVSEAPLLKPEQQTVLPDPTWGIQIGQSNLVMNMNYANLNASGLSVGLSHNFTKFVGIGMGYTNYKLDGTAITSLNANNNIGTNFDLITGFLEITPIHYSLGPVDLMGAIQLGWMNASAAAVMPVDGDFFYGASLAIRVSKQIGVSLSAEVAKEFQSLYGISLVGYF
jgi:hypothetical protein